MSAVLAPSLSVDEARSLTDEVKNDAERLWRKLVELYEGGAHLALGYAAWGSYFEAEFGQSKSHGYRMLEAARVASVLPHSPLGERPTERQARELAPLLGDADQLRDAWQEANKNGQATAATVREAVERRLPEPRPTGTRPLDPDIMERHQRDTAVEVLDRSVYALESNIADIPIHLDWILETRDLAGPYGVLTPERLNKASDYCAAFAAELKKRGI